MSNNFPTFPGPNDDSPSAQRNPQGDSSISDERFHREGVVENLSDAHQHTYGQIQHGSYESFPGDQNQLISGSNRPGAWKRFLGYFIDAFLVSVVGGIIGLLLFRNFLSDSSSASEKPSTAGSESLLFDRPMLGISAVILVLWFIYRIVFDVKTGGTLGKKIIGAKVTMEDGSRVTYSASFIRNCWYLTEAVPIVGSLLRLVAMIAIGVTIRLNNGNQSFIDRWSKTVVVDK